MYSRADGDYWARQICESLKKTVNCLSKIRNKDCFAPDIFQQHAIIHRMYPLWIVLQQNINMCGRGSEQDLSQIGCLYKESINYAQHCGIMELDDCE